MRKLASRWLWVACWMLCTSMAVAQTAPSSKPSTSTATVTAPPKPSVAGTTVTASTSANKTATASLSPLRVGEIYRWTDSKGRVQYGQSVPEEYRANARKVDTRGNIVSSRVPASISPAPQPEPGNAAPMPRQPITEREKCEAAWKQYNEAQACFAQYRQGTVGGAGRRSGSNVSPEALEKCPVLTEPAACR